MFHVCFHWRSKNNLRSLFVKTTLNFSVVLRWFSFILNSEIHWSSKRGNLHFRPLFVTWDSFFLQRYVTWYPCYYLLLWKVRKCRPFFFFVTKRGHSARYPGGECGNWGRELRCLLVLWRKLWKESCLFRSSHIQRCQAFSERVKRVWSKNSMAWELAKVQSSY